MLGSVSEADDAMQEAWLRFSRSGADGIENLGAWLTTVVARVCLDTLRSRKSRREDSLEASATEPAPHRPETNNPENEAVLADSVGLALLVVLETLAPAERLAFVLHDMFDVPFDEIADIVGRTPAAARQLASRARRRVRGSSAVQKPALTAQRKIVDAFLAAIRNGDFEALVAVLDPNVVVRADAAAVSAGAATEIRGAQASAKQALAFARGAAVARPALVDGSVGIVVAPRGRLTRAISFTFKRGKIAQINVIADPERLASLALAVLEN